jgi:hypothetical protein
MSQRPIPPLVEAYPFRLDAGWFEVYDQAGRYLGLIDRALPLAQWVQRRCAGTRWRIVWRSPEGGGRALCRWESSPRPGEALPSFEVVTRPCGGSPRGTTA